MGTKNEAFEKFSSLFSFLIFFDVLSRGEKQQKRFFDTSAYQSQRKFHTWLLLHPHLIY